MSKSFHQFLANIAIQGGFHYDKQIDDGGKGEKEKWRGSCAVERGRSAETKEVGSRLMWVACLPL